MGNKEISSTAFYIIITLMFTIILTMFGVVFYGLFTYAKYLGASNFGAVVAIFMLVSSCSATAERIKRKNVISNNENL